MNHIITQPIPCPPWCTTDSPGHEVHAGVHRLDASTEIVLTCAADGSDFTAEVLGQPTLTAETGSVALPAAALMRLASLLASL